MLIIFMDVVLKFEAPGDFFSPRLDYKPHQCVSLICSLALEHLPFLLHKNMLGKISWKELHAT
jgi:hypothetical protein